MLFHSKPVTILPTLHQATVKDALPTLTTLTPADEDVTFQLTAYASRLYSLEHHLRMRTQWLPPVEPSPLPNDTLDIPDLTNAVNLLPHIISAIHPARALTPQISFSAAPWT